VLDAETWVKDQPDASRGLMIDLHWRVPGIGASPERAWSTFWDRRDQIPLRGALLPSPEQTAVALHLAMHAAQHGPLHPRALEDLRRGVVKWPPELWTEAHTLAQDLNAVEALSSGLRLIPEGTALADELGLPRFPEREWAIRHRHDRPRGSFHLQALREAPGLSARLRVARHSLLPTPAWLAHEYPWAAASRARLPLAYAAHLARAPAWGLRAWRYRARARRESRP
jgi:hypothetical protein